MGATSLYQITRILTNINQFKNQKTKEEKKKKLAASYKYRLQAQTRKVKYQQHQ